MPQSVVDAYVRGLPAPATWERVAPGFWYVRIPGSARRWIPIELRLGERTLKATSAYCIPPAEQPEDAYRYLLAHNLRATGVAFASAPDRNLCIVGRLPVASLDSAALDLLVGKIVDLTEATFQAYLRIGFASRFI